MAVPKKASVLWICTSIPVWLLPAYQVCAHIIKNSPDEAKWQVISDHLNAIQQQMPFFIQVGGSVAASWYFFALLALPVVGTILWKYRSDQKMLYLAAIAAVTAAGSSYGIYPLIGPSVKTMEVEDCAACISHSASLTICKLFCTSDTLTGPKALEDNIEVGNRQFAVFIGYYMALVVSYISGWSMLAVNRFSNNRRLLRLGVCALLVSVVLLWIIHSFWYISPLNQMWWA